MAINKIKLIVPIFIFFILINIITPVHASAIDEIWQQSADFISLGKSSQTGTFNGDNMKSAIDTLYSIAWWAGLAIAAIIGTYLGIQFMTQGVEGKAKIKEALIPYVVGCVIIFGGFTIWGVAMNLFRQMERTETGTVASVQNCEEGHHSYEYYSGKQHICKICGNIAGHTYSNAWDENCNECLAECKHEFTKTGGGLYMTCGKCGVSFAICNTPDSPRTQHYYGNGIESRFRKKYM